MKVRLWLTSFCLAALAASAQAATITIQVLDAGTPVPFTHAGGGTFVGSGALKAAVDAVMADTGRNNADTYDIQIKDTDGTADTYTGTLFINDYRQHITIRQVSSGNANEKAVTIAPDDPNPKESTITADTCADIKIIGLSPEKKMIVKAIAGKRALDLRGTWATTAPDEQKRDLVENVAVQGPASNDVLAWGAVVDFNKVDFTGTGEWKINMQKFGIDSKVTFNDCVITGNNGHFVFVHQGGHEATYNRCTIALNGPSFWGSGGVHKARFNDCTFSFGPSGLLIATTWLPDLAAGGAIDIAFNNPTFTNACSTIFMNTDGAQATIAFNGKSAAEKADLRPIRTGTAQMGRFTSGTLSFTNCLIDDRVDGQSDNADDNKWVANFVFDGCEVADADFGAVANTWPKRNFKATNSIFKLVNRDDFLIMCWAAAGCTIDLEHCTFIGGTKQWFATENSDTINAKYCVFSRGGSLALVHNNPKGTVRNSVIYGGNAGFGTNVTLAENLTGDPKLDANGRPQANSSAIALAKGSTAATDFGGQSRPRGPQQYADAGAFEVDLVPVELSGLGIE